MKTTFCSVALIAIVVSACVTSPDEGLEDEDAGPTSLVGKTPRRGHYISFGTFIDLKTEMMDILDAPSSYTDTRVAAARYLRDTITAPGVQGVWIPFDWDLVEIANNEFNWVPFEHNLRVAQRLGLRVIMKFSDRSFNGRNIMPDYFPAQYSIAVGGRTDALDGYVSKRWDPYVYNKIVRLLRAAATRYDAHPAFEGIATTETAPGQFDLAANGYTKEAYENALITIVNNSKTAFVQSKLFFYINFIPLGGALDLSRDSRTKIISAIRGSSISIGGPDVMADDEGHADSANLVYIWAEQMYPNLTKSCHAQFNDYQQAKTNAARIDYKTRTGAFPDDILRTLGGNEVDLHPSAELGILWTPFETFRYGLENFGCNYFFWHFRRSSTGYETADVLPVIRDHAAL